LSRIRILVSAHWITDPNPDPVPAVNVSGYQDTKIHLQQSSKITSDYEVTKQLKSRFFLLFLLLNGGSRSGSVQIITIITDPDPGGPKASRSGTLSLSVSFHAVLQWGMGLIQKEQNVTRMMETKVFYDQMQCYRSRLIFSRYGGSEIFITNTRYKMF
jgi:hypothetical protein